MTFPEWSSHYQPPAPQTLEEKVKALKRESLVQVLENNGFECYDTETVEELQTAIVVNVNDGDISESDVDLALSLQ